VANHQLKLEKPRLGHDYINTGIKTIMVDSYELPDSKQTKPDIPYFTSVNVFGPAGTYQNISGNVFTLSSNPGFYASGATLPYGTSLPIRGDLKLHIAKTLYLDDKLVIDDGEYQYKCHPLELIDAIGDEQARTDYLRSGRCNLKIGDGFIPLTAN
jgi:hypothetical protein